MCMCVCKPPVAQQIGPLQHACGTWVSNTTENLHVALRVLDKVIQPCVLLTVSLLWMAHLVAQGEVGA